MAEKIQRGELKLNQISLVQKAAREIAKNKPLENYKFENGKVTAAQKLEVIESLCNKGSSESQQKVAIFFDLPALHSTHQKIQADESVRIELTLTKEAFAKVKRAQELLSHAIGTQDMGQFLEYLAGKVIQQKTATATMAGETPPQVFKESAKKAPSQRDIKSLRQQQTCCQFTDPTTGRKCQSSWKLQVDHKQSRWAGGKHNLENLQQLCAAHNKMKYRKEVGLRYL